MGSWLPSMTTGRLQKAHVDLTANRRNALAFRLAAEGWLWLACLDLLETKRECLSPVGQHDTKSLAQPVAGQP